MYQSLIQDFVVPEELLWKNTPKDKIGNYDHLVEVIDWDLNIDPNFKMKHFMKPKPVKNLDEMKTEGYIEKWICYKSKSLYKRK